MTSAIAILTFRRLPALLTELEGLRQHTQPLGVPVAVFEDCGNRDNTAAYLSQGPHRERPDLLATQYDHPDGFQAFVGHVNLGVAGNSNRALHWLAMENPGTDHYCLLNDDLQVHGDFVNFYATAHKTLGIGFFCFNDFWESETHRWIIARSRGYRLKLFTRMTGIMLSITRSAFNKVGYFDTRFGQFGQEHCDYTNRMRMAGEMHLDGQMQACVDVDPSLPNGQAGPPLLRHQNVASSLLGPERIRADQEADVRLAEVIQSYQYEHFHKPFSLTQPRRAGVLAGQGIETSLLTGYGRATLSPICS